MAADSVADLRLRPCLGAAAVPGVMEEDPSTVITSSFVTELGGCAEAMAMASGVGALLALVGFDFW